MFAPPVVRQRAEGYKLGIAKHRETMRESKTGIAQAQKDYCEDATVRGHNRTGPDLCPIRLDPVALNHKSPVDGFWIHGDGGMAYHLVQVAPVREDGDGEMPWMEGGHAALKERGKSWYATNHPLLKSVFGMGGELPSMEPTHALEPERVQHLEEVSSFLYNKLGRPTLLACV